MSAKFLSFYLAFNAFILMDTFVSAQSLTYLNFTDISNWNIADACVTDCISSVTEARILSSACEQPNPPATCICGSDFLDIESVSDSAANCALFTCQGDDVDTAGGLMSSFCAGNSAIAARTPSSSGSEASSTPGECRALQPCVRSSIAMRHSQC